MNPQAAGNTMSKIEVNRIVTDIAIKDGRIMDAINLAKRGVQLVLEAATRRQQEIEQEIEAERRAEIYGTFTITTDTTAGSVSTTQVCSAFTPDSGEGCGRVQENGTDSDLTSPKRLV